MLLGFFASLLRLQYRELSRERTRLEGVHKPEHPRVVSFRAASGDFELSPFEIGLPHTPGWSTILPLLFPNADFRMRRNTGAIRSHRAYWPAARILTAVVQAWTTAK
jgi:hypothetical protein